MGSPLARILAPTAGDAFLQFFPSAYFPFLSFLQSMRSLLREGNRSVQLQHAQLDRHQLTTLSLHLLRQKVLCWPTPRPAATISILSPLPHSTASSAVQHTHFWVQDGYLVCPCMLCRSVVFFFGGGEYACPISYKLKGREKQSNSHHHNADITII